MTGVNYLKYYWLEKYLFEDVHKNFNERGYLTPEEFFCIVIWKSNRAKTKIKRKLLKLGNLNTIIKNITNQIFETSDSQEKLNVLLKKYNFALPMATAILTVLYPKDFTIYDVRVRKQLKTKEIYGIRRYFKEFLPKVKKISVQRSLRDKDRELWGKSFYEDLKKFLKN